MSFGLSIASKLLKSGVKKLGSLVAGGDSSALKEVANVLGEDADKHEALVAALDDPNNVKLLLEYEGLRQEQLTVRHDQDMKSDSWLSKNIRPMTLVALTLFLGYGCVSTMPDFKFNKIVELNLYIYSFYFFARSLLDKNKGGLASTFKKIMGR